MQVNDLAKKKFYAYSDMKLGNQNKAWKPHIACKKMCWSSLSVDKKRTKMRCEIPLIWCEPRSHVDNCYFCITLAYGLCLKPKIQSNNPTWTHNNWDDWNFPLVSEEHDVTDCELLDISEICTSSSTSTVPQP